MNSSSNGGTRELNIKQSWPILINILKTEDIYGCSTRFCPIPKFNTDDIPSDLTRSLFAVMPICKNV